jgi:muramoyltetrapeptide carboxypeptidase
MILPPSLHPGDTIGVCAPARKVSREDVAGGIELLQSWGYKVLEAPNLYGAYHQFSGTDHERRQDLQFLLDHPEVKAIISARGGYGSVRLIDQLSWDEFSRNPKWIIGFSDITVFHNHLHRHYRIPTLHAPMLFNLSGEKLYMPAATRLKEILEGDFKPVKGVADQKIHSLNINGEASGVLVGGNLSLLYALSGSDSDIETNGKILFLEDLDEYLYHIDRMMMQLLRSGKLNSLKGLIVGGMNDMKDNAVPFGETAEQIIRRFCEPFDFPLWFGFPAGHIPENLPFILGTEVKMSVGNHLSLSYVHPA